MGLHVFSVHDHQHPLMMMGRGFLRKKITVFSLFAQDMCLSQFQGHFLRVREKAEISFAVQFHLVVNGFTALEKISFSIAFLQLLENSKELSM